LSFAALSGCPGFPQTGHGQESLAVSLVDFVNRADVGMIEQRRGPRLVQEARLVLCAFKQVRGQKLQATARPSFKSSDL
jgi:hypothetical protein